ncbi:hypothetical protein HK102_010191 [Quaeritorhiza haematococci]|nr:hypothetical protein HK102_010191 [Quaeritorhiza haematococci]
MDSATLFQPFMPHQQVVFPDFNTLKRLVESKKQKVGVPSTPATPPSTPAVATTTNTMPSTFNNVPPMPIPQAPPMSVAAAAAANLRPEHFNTMQAAQVVFPDMATIVALHSKKKRAMMEESGPRKKVDVRQVETKTQAMQQPQERRLSEATPTSIEPSPTPTKPATEAVAAVSTSPSITTPPQPIANQAPIQPAVSVVQSDTITSERRQSLLPPHLNMPLIPTRSSVRIDFDPNSEILPNGKRKPGRKIVQDDPQDKRLAQNRAAQRAFRERRARYTVELEARIVELQDYIREIQQQQPQTGTDAGDVAATKARIAQQADEFEKERREMKTQIETLNERMKSLEEKNQDLNNQLAEAKAAAATAASTIIPVVPPARRASEPVLSSLFNANVESMQLESFFTSPTTSVSELSDALTTESMSLTSLTTPNASTFGWDLTGSLLHSTGIPDNITLQSSAMPCDLLFPIQEASQQAPVNDLGAWLGDVTF